MQTLDHWFCILMQRCRKKDPVCKVSVTERNCSSWYYNLIFSNDLKGVTYAHGMPQTGESLSTEQFSSKTILEIIWLTHPVCHHGNIVLGLVMQHSPVDRKLSIASHEVVNLLALKLGLFDEKSRGQCLPVTLLTLPTHREGFRAGWVNVTKSCHSDVLKCSNVNESLPGILTRTTQRLFLNAITSSRDV